MLALQQTVVDNQSIKQSSNQSIKQSIKQSSKQASKQAINQSIDQSNSQSTIQQLVVILPWFQLGPPIPALHVLASRWVYGHGGHGMCVELVVVGYHDVCRVNRDVHKASAVICKEEGVVAIRVDVARLRSGASSNVVREVMLVLHVLQVMVMAIEVEVHLQF